MITVRKKVPDTDHRLIMFPGGDHYNLEPWLSGKSLY